MVDLFVIPFCGSSWTDHGSTAITALQIGATSLEIHAVAAKSCCGWAPVLTLISRHKRLELTSASRGYCVKAAQHCPKPKTTHKSGNSNGRQTDVGSKGKSQQPATCRFALPPRTESVSGITRSRKDSTHPACFNR